MKTSQILANSVLWATAILGAAAYGAPSTLVLILLPSLAAISLVVSAPERTVKCAVRRR